MPRRRAPGGSDSGLRFSCRPAPTSVVADVRAQQRERLVDPLDAADVGERELGDQVVLDGPVDVLALAAAERGDERAEVVDDLARRPRHAREPRRVAEVVDEARLAQQQLRLPARPQPRRRVAHEREAQPAVLGEQPLALGSRRSGSAAARRARAFMSCTVSAGETSGERRARRSARGGARRARPASTARWCSAAFGIGRNSTRCSRQHDGALEHVARERELRLGDGAERPPDGIPAPAGRHPVTILLPRRTRELRRRAADLSMAAHRRARSSWWPARAAAARACSPASSSASATPCRRPRSRPTRPTRAASPSRSGSWTSTRGCSSQRARADRRRAARPRGREMARVGLDETTRGPSCARGSASSSRAADDVIVKDPRLSWFLPLWRSVRAATSAPRRAS